MLLSKSPGLLRQRLGRGLNLIHPSRGITEWCDWIRATLEPYPRNIYIYRGMHENNHTFHIGLVMCLCKTKYTTWIEHNRTLAQAMAMWINNLFVQLKADSCSYLLHWSANSKHHWKIVFFNLVEFGKGKGCRFHQVAPSATSSMACFRIGPASADRPGMDQFKEGITGHRAVCASPTQGHCK